MKKNQFRALLLIISVLFVFVLVSCGSSSNNNQSVVNDDDIINDTAEEKQKYVIELNVDNYLKYIDIRNECGENMDIVYKFYGSLSYAFYDTVVITYKTGKTTELSAGGYGYYYNSRAGQQTVTNVTGKVIYWI